jgi:hypothetical protein
MDGLSDISNPIKFMMINVQDDNGTELSATTIQHQAKQKFSYHIKIATKDFKIGAPYE